MGQTGKDHEGGESKLHLPYWCSLSPGSLRPSDTEQKHKQSKHKLSNLHMYLDQFISFQFISNIRLLFICVRLQLFLANQLDFRSKQKVVSKATARSQTEIYPIVVKEAYFLIRWELVFLYLPPQSKLKWINTITACGFVFCYQEDRKLHHLSPQSFHIVFIAARRENDSNKM